MGTSSGSLAGMRHRKALLRALLLGLAGIIFLFPLFWTVLASLGVVPNNTDSPPIWDWPPSLQSFADIGVAEPGFLSELTTSLSISLTATILALFVSLLAAFSLARSRLKNVRTVIQIFLILASLPVMAYVIPLSDTIRHLGLYDTFIGVALANTAIFAPLSIYVLFGYLRQIPADLEEAARLDGASLGQILWRIVVPVAAPGLAATAIILFVLNWNLLLVPLVLTEAHVKTIPIAMSDFFTFERDLQWPVAAAVLVTSLLPLVLLVGLAHRWLEHFSLWSSREDY
jgi:ABC-type glycerol-3-phosphate transport system permease component